MKITLTHAELTRIVTKYFNIDDVNNSITVEVSDTASAANELFLATLNKIGALISPNKIAAIKEYRAFSGLGLREAKDIIENWDSARAQMERLGTFVKFQYVPNAYGSTDLIIGTFVRAKSL